MHRPRGASLRAGLALLLTALTILATTLDGAEVEDDVPLNFVRLDLTDGRSLRNVVVKTYDAKTGKLLLVANGKAMSVPIALVPPPFDAKLKRAPESGSRVSVIVEPAVSRQPIAPASAQYGLATPPPTSSPVIKRVTREEFDIVHGKAPAAPPINFAPHQRAARSRAETYFRYEHQVGSNSILVSDLFLEMGLPVSVPGWDGRCRTEGKAFFGFYDSRGRSFQRGTSNFEVTTEISGEQGMRIVEFRRKD